MADAVLCVDIGSTSLKAAFMTDSPEPLAYTRQVLAESGSNFAACEWLSALAKAVSVLKTLAPNTGIEAVVISGNGPTLVSPTGETLMWNEEVPTNLELPKSKSLYIPRIDAFRRKYPETWKVSSKIFSGPEFLVWTLTGKAVTFLPEERFGEYYWTKDLLKAANFSDEEISKLPEFIEPAKAVGKITEAAALATGLLEGTFVISGVPDFIAAMLGTNTVLPGLMCDRAGSSEGLNLCTDQPLEGDKIRTMPSIIPGLWNASVLIPDSGVEISAFKHKLEVARKEKIEWPKLLSSLVDYRRGKTVALLSEKEAEEGSQILFNNAHKVWAACNILNSAAKRAGLKDPMYMTVAGGQAQNDAWMQLKCDTAGIPVWVTSCPDSELAGDNILARISLGDYDSFEAAAFCLTKTAKKFSPATPVDKK